MPEGQVIKLVNATSLDNGLTSIADAIRTKGGTSADLTFPDGFVDAVEAIPTGGGGVHTGTVTPTTRTTTMTMDIGISTINGLFIVPTSESPVKSTGKACIAVFITPNNYYKYIAPTTNNAGSSWLTPSYSTTDTFVTLNGTVATVKLSSTSGSFETISYTWYAW